MRRGSLAHAVLEQTLRRWGADGLGALTPAAPGRAARSWTPRWRRARRGAGTRARARDARAGGGAARLLRVEAECGAGLEPEWLEWGFGGARRGRAAAARGDGLGVTGRVDRIDVGPAAARWCATTRGARSSPARAGRPTASSRRRCTRSPRASCSGSSPPARSTSRSGPDVRPRGARPRRRRPAARQRRRAGRAAFEPRSSRGARDRRARGARPARRARSAPCPERVHAARRLRLPGHLPRGGREPPSGGVTALAAEPSAGAIHAPSSGRRSTDRTGSALLAANAGSGKTAVMVERFVEAVLHDGVAVGAILALTFTEKAAGELRERIRRPVHRARRGRARARGRGAPGSARSTASAPGCCARTRSPRGSIRASRCSTRRPPGGWPRPPTDRRSRRGRRRAGHAAVDLAAAYGTGLRGHDPRRPRDAAQPRARRHPRLPIPPPQRAARSPPRWARPRDAAAAALAGAARTARRSRRRRGAGRRCGGRRRPRCRGPTELDLAKLGTGAKALERAGVRRLPRGVGGVPPGLRRPPRPPAVALLDDLLDRFGTAYDAAKAARAGVDFADLELRVRDLLADPAARARWAERFEADHGRRVPGHQPAAARRARVARARQPVRGRRRVPVDLRLPPRRRGDLPRAAGAARRGPRPPADAQLPLGRGAARRAQRGVRGRSRATVHAARRRRGRGAARTRPLRLFDPIRRRGEPAGRAADHRHARLGRDRSSSASRPHRRSHTQPWRRAEARMVAQRLRAEIDDGRRPGEIVVLVRATGSLRLLEQALEEQGLPTYVVGGRGYWSQEQVRDGLAYLARAGQPARRGGALARARLAVLRRRHRRARAARRRGPRARPRRAGGAARGRAAAWSAALPGRPSARGSRASPASSPPSARGPSALPVEVLLERAIVATGYDLAVLARSGGERRLANLRKLMRLAREYERAEGRDLRGFLDFARNPGPAGAREGEAALEGEGLDAVRLMTIHRAKGLEFPVVCVADLGPRRRAAPRAPAARPRRPRRPAAGADRRRRAASRARLRPASTRSGGARRPKRSDGCSTSR